MQMEESGRRLRIEPSSSRYLPTYHRALRRPWVPRRSAVTSAASVDCAAAIDRATAAGTAFVAAFSDELQAGMMCSGVFIVENVESRQADVRDFFLTVSN